MTEETEKGQPPAPVPKPEILPPGKVRISTGAIVDRADVCFGLYEHPLNKNVLKALDKTLYQRDATSGVIRRVTPKPPTKQERRAERERKMKKQTPPA